MKTSIKFCLIKSDNLFLCKEFDPGYHYSKYTNQSASLSIEWRMWQDIVGVYTDCNPIIFESEDAAHLYMKGWPPDKEYEVINVEDVWSLAEKILLEQNDGKTR